MKRNAHRILAAFTALSIALCAGCSKPDDTESSSSGESEAEVQNASPLGEWDELDQTAITSAMGMGWNLGNQLEASSNTVPSETAWGNPTVTPELIAAVKDAGFSTIRIPVSYLSTIGEAPDYTIDPAWLDRIQQVVDYVVSNDMFAIVNMHGDGYYTVPGAWLLCAEDETAQTEIKAKYAAVWAQIAERFKDYDEHLIFESMNEEFNNTYGEPDPDAYQNINDYNRIFTDTVRGTGGNNDKRWLLMPGWNTNIDHTCAEKGFVIPEDTLCTSDGKRIMISVHYYDPYNFSLDENISTWKTQWGKYAVEDYDSWGQEDYVDKQMKALNDRFTSQGYPVVIGEMGVQDKSIAAPENNEFRRYWCEYVVKAAKANGAIPVYWDNGHNGTKGFGLFNRNVYTQTQPEIIAAMMRAINSEGDYEIPAVVLDSEDETAPAA